MGKFTVEADDFPQQEIEAENAEKAAWAYCGERQMDEQMIKKHIEYEYVSATDGKGQKTEFKAEIIDRNLDLSQL